MYKKELCREFNLTYKTLNKLIVQFEKLIGKPYGYNYLPYQVKIIRNIFNSPKYLVVSRKKKRQSAIRYQQKAKSKKQKRYTGKGEIPRI